jgi:hypothetical protein
MELKIKKPGSDGGITSWVISFPRSNNGDKGILGEFFKNPDVAIHL